MAGTKLPSPPDIDSLTVSAIKGQYYHFSKTVSEGVVNPTDGSYTLEKLPAGTYYLEIDSKPLACWAPSKSVTDCNEAGFISIATGEMITGKDFELEIGAGEINGTVYEVDGVTPITKGAVKLVSGDDACNGKKWSKYIRLDSVTGSYRADKLPPGTYFLHAGTWNIFLDEWWTGTGGSLNCSAATPIIISGEETHSNKDFQMSLGAIVSGTIFHSDGITPLLDWHGEVSVYEGDAPCQSCSFLMAV